MEEKKEECQSCKDKSFTKSQWSLITLSFYILGTSIYGTIELFKLIVSLF